MNTKKYFKIVKYAILLGLLFLIVIYTGPKQDVLSGNDDRQINSVTAIRISHPDVVIGNHHYSTNNPFNYAEDKVLMYEVTSADVYPPNQITGRGFVWGYIDELRQGFLSLADYQEKAKILPKYNNYAWDGYSVLFSPYNNENDIVYGLVRNLDNIIKMNVVTGVGESLISHYDVDNSIDYGDYVDPFIVGWTLDNNLVVGSNYSNNAWGPCFEFNIKTKQITYYQNYPGGTSALARRFPTNGHGHGGKNKSRTYQAMSYGQSQENYVLDLTTGAQYEDCSYEDGDILPLVSDVVPSHSPYTNHACWMGSDDWMVVSANGFTDNSSYTSPSKRKYYFYQVYPSYDNTSPCSTGGNTFEYRLLTTIIAPVSWCKVPNCDHNSSDYIYMYSEAPHCVVAPSGNKMYCSYVDNQYAYRDYVYGGSAYADYGLPGAWVYDLASVNQPKSILPDLNQDSFVNLSDLNLFKSYFQSQNTISDFNQDQKTNTQDLGIMMSVWGSY